MSVGRLFMRIFSLCNFYKDKSVHGSFTTGWSAIELMTQEL